MPNDAARWIQGYKHTLIVQCLPTTIEDNWNIEPGGYFERLLQPKRNKSLKWPPKTLITLGFAKAESVNKIETS